MNVENIVIGKPIVDIWHLLGNNKEDLSWENVTHHTDERFLPKILREANITEESNSWFKKNKPEYFINLDKLDCLEVRLSKKKPVIYIVVGE